MYQNLRRFFKENTALFILISSFFLLKILSLLKYHLPIWDEAVYLGMGKYIYSLGGAGLWEIIRPLGLPLVLGWAWRLGMHYVKSAEFIILLFALGNICLTYFIGKKVFNGRTARLSLLLLAITPVFFVKSSYILTEIPSTFFVLLALYLFLENKHILSGVCCGLAFMFKFPQGLVLLTLLLVLFIEFMKNKRFKLFIVKSSKITLSFLITISPFMVFNYLMYKNITSKIQSALLPFILSLPHQYNPAGEVIVPGKMVTYVYNYLYFIINTIIQNPLLIFVFIGILYYFKERLYKKSKTTAIVIALLLPLLYFTYIPAKQARYVITFLPFVCLLASYGLFETWKSMKKHRKPVKYTFTILLFILIIFSLGITYKENKKAYDWRPVQEPEIVEFYEYFLTNPANPILTTDPVPAAFTDNVFIPMYDNPEEALRIYKQEKDNAQAVVYTPHFYPCEIIGPRCEEQKQELFRMMNQDFVLEINKTYNRQNYYIFRGKNE
jgi:hypothetical protein